MATESPPPQYTFTVFTPTRNRAHTLARVWETLRAQTFRDFEWLIIDNESTDGTADLVASWEKDADFPMRYVYQQNRGQHGSLNRAVSEARGALFLTLDSDDRCPPDFLERFKAIWDSIPDDERPRFVGVTGHTSDEAGNLHGTAFPFDPTDSDSVEIRFRYKVKGEKFGFQRTEVMRESPLPEIEGYTGLMPNSIAWNAIARKYKTRYVNEVLKTYYTDEPTSLSRPARHFDDAPGALIESRSLLNDHIRWFRYAPWTFYLKAAKFCRNAFHTSLSPLDQFRQLSNARARLLWLAALPLGTAIYLAERGGFAHLLPGPRERTVAVRR